MGRHYRANTEGGPIGFMKALWSSQRWCQWVEPSEGANGEGKGVLFFRNRNGLGVPPSQLRADEGESKSGAITATAAKMTMVVGEESDVEVS